MSPISHFTCLVIGDDPEGQLAPYNEELQVPPYKCHTDEDDVARFRGYYATENPGKSGTTVSLKKLAEFMTTYYQEPYSVDELGLHSWSTYSQNSKWDWYSVGGRWQGFFKLKPGAQGRLGEPSWGEHDPLYDADQARMGDIDWDFMRDDAGEKAGARWDRAIEVAGDTPVPEPWESVRERFEAELPDRKQALDGARTFYHDQERVLAFKAYDHKCREEGRGEDQVLGFMGGCEEFSVSREVYVQAARDRAYAPYSYLLHGEWHAPGRMGWFGMSTEDEEEKRLFQIKFQAMLDGLDDDVMLTLYDLHI